MVQIESGGKTFYMDGYLKELLDSFKYAVNEKNTSVVIIVDGRSGMGKTTLGNQIAKYCDPSYNLSQIYFEPEVFLEGLANAKPQTCHVFDEAMLISNRSVMSQINRMIIQAMAMIRSKRIFVIFNVNSLFDLDRNLVLSRADLLLHVYGNNLLDRGNFAAFFKSKGGEDRLKLLFFLGKKYYSYNRPKANFYGRFYMPFILDEKKYEEIKQEGINNFLRSDMKPLGKGDLFVYYLIKYLREEDGLTMKKIAQIGQVAESSVYNRVKRGNILANKIK